MRRHRHRFKMIFAMSLALAAITAPSAAARFEGPVGGHQVLSHQSTPQSTNLCSEVCDNAITRLRPAVTPIHPSTQTPASKSVSTGSSVRAAGRDGGFAWGDAGIGAGVAFAVLILVLGGTAAATARRRVGEHGAPAAG